MANKEINSEYFPAIEDPIRDDFVRLGSGSVEVTWTEINHDFKLVPYFGIHLIRLDKNRVIWADHGRAVLIHLDTLEQKELPSDPMWGHHIVRIGKPHKEHPDRVRLMAMIQGGGYAFCNSEDWKWTELKSTRIPPEACPHSTLLLKSGDLRVTWASFSEEDSWSKLYTYKHKTDEWIEKDDHSIYSSDPCGPSCQLSPSVSFHAEGPRGTLYHQDHSCTKIKPFVKGERPTRFSRGGCTLVNAPLGNGVALFVNKDYYRNYETYSGSYVYGVHLYDHSTGELKQLLEFKDWNEGQVTQLSPNLFALIGGYRGSEEDKDTQPLTHLELFTDQGSLHHTDYQLPAILKKVSAYYVAPGRVFVKAETRLWLLKLDRKTSESESSDEHSFN